ncbi:putative redox protein, regulator of disulfide bond formation [Sphaerochaeta pleomorpha str. Grapes]|uniref:Putative redox protein, regulator of disulfide bond formation n=1 Tax=Sphaerochaeta pleomorpha (strain ATCC BAA-1885 / DSM 22778 / Grapes) TaxID=158190 RepID=G8QST5_SPHPG|nr:OsmC family protein [Sphaerochaeta pleomorpha]AEV30117.1 putative redox protein, regulator of disulfide bond formation [Sphaerochaeta pleomorpha str. Grapes]
MSEVHTYHTAVQWSEERKGMLSSEGLSSIEVATPPQFPGGHAGIWSPEHLFVASAEVCLMTTFLSLAEKARLEFQGYHSEARGTLEKTEAGFWMTQIVITPTLVIADEELREKALNLFSKAEKYCLISNSMKTEVRIEPIVEVI